MDIFQAIIYGIIQGLAEFLPISSSGHLALLPHFLGIGDPGVFFDLMMHLGTVFSVIVYFRKDIFKYCKALPKLFRPEYVAQDIALIKNIFISTSATVFIALPLKGLALNYGRNMNFIIINLIIFGILMFLADFYQSYKEKKRELRHPGVQVKNVSLMEERTRIKESLLIGFSQAISLFPGVSRSGITLTVSRLCGLSRAESGRYSLLLSLPIVLLGIAYKIFMIDTIPAILPLVVGAGVSFVVGLIAIHIFLSLVAKIGVSPFAVYRILFAVFLYVFFLRN